LSKFGAAEKSPGVTRRNVITRGADLNSLVGQRFYLQGIEFEGVSRVQPVSLDESGHCSRSGGRVARARRVAGPDSDRWSIAGGCMNFSAIILAGGKSSRMGRDKAWLEVGGKTLLARQIELAGPLARSEVFISGRTGRTIPNSTPAC
jgi:hypothetical protein